MDAGARVPQRSLVIGLRGLRDVELLVHRAVVLLRASVADERRISESVADVFPEVWTSLEALRLVLAQALARCGEGLKPAFLVVGAETVRASVALVAVHPAVAQLVRGGLGAPAHVLGDSAHRPSEFGKEPETLPVA